MRGVFDDKFEEPEPQRDPELTLGAGMLLLLFFALVLVCGVRSRPSRRPAGRGRPAFLGQRADARAGRRFAAQTAGDDATRGNSDIPEHAAAGNRRCSPIRRQNPAAGPEPGRSPFRFAPGSSRPGSCG